MPVMDLGIAGRTALVGASSGGLGLGVAKALAAAGVHVAINGRDPDRLDRAARELSAQHPGVEILGLGGDVAQIDGARNTAVAAVDHFGGIDILVLNAGGPPAGGWDAFGADRYVEAVAATAGSAIAAIEVAVAGMRQRSWGRVIAITSQTVREPLGNLALSGVARTALTAYLKTMAREVAAEGVTVNTVQPGSHDTDRLRSLHGDNLSAAAKTIPVGRVGEAEDFGRAVAFLCSESAKFITGVSLPVDGGVSHGLQ